MKKSVSRADQQLNEKLDGQRIDAPESRFQTEQQVNPAIKAGSNAAPDDSFVSKVNKANGSTLRQEVASEVLSSKNAKAAVSGVSSPTTYGLKSMAFSGDTGTILGNASGTPTLENDFQGKTRFDKRISDANKDINFNASEQIVTEFRQIPALADSESSVGYNGNPKNVAARSQKNAGLTPAEELYDRSVDFVGASYGVFTSGQRVNQDMVETDDYPTGTYTLDDKGNWQKKAFTVGKEPISGNFMPDALHVQITKDNSGTYVSKFEVLERDISANQESYATVNASCTNAVVDRNQSELARQRIDAVAGSPTSAHFNPLGRSIEEATRYIQLLRDIESATGATVFAAYKFAQKSRGHYLNRTAKDGQTLEDPAIDALYGGLTNATSMSELKALLGEADSRSPLFYKKGNNYGSAALMIAAFDSLGKYKTKADIINQARSLKMHLQTADNNMDPFRCKKEFVAAINSVDAYSSIDHAYDPSAPVYIADDFKLIYPYSLNRALNFTRSSAGVKTYGSEVPTYYYAAGAGINTYYVMCADPLLNGVAYFLDMHAAELFENLAGDKTTRDLYIPMTHSTTHFSLWDYLVCASTPYIIYERTNTMKDILDFELNFEYPFAGLVKIKDANPMAAVNYGNPSAQTPLEVKQMLPSSAIRWKNPEMLYPLGNKRYLLPWYFNERDITWQDANTQNVMIEIEAAENFTTPVVRNGVKLSALDEFFDMGPEDQMLNLDCMTRTPGIRDFCGGGVYKYSQGGDGIPFIDATAGKGYDAVTVNDFMATPRQLGWFMILPGGVTIPKRAAVGEANFTDYAKVNRYDEELITEAGTSFFATQYKGGYQPTAVNDDILGDDSVMVNRAQAFTQNWVKRFADYAGTSASNFDVRLSIVDGFTAVDPAAADIHLETIDGETTFRPFTVGPYSRGGANKMATVFAGSSIDTVPKLFTVMRGYWATIQKLCFLINPFGAKVINTLQSEASVDPYDVAYLFGLAGFVAANYYELQYDRANQVMNQGYGYTIDPFVAKSPVFKDAVIRTL